MPASEKTIKVRVTRHDVTYPVLVCATAQARELRKVFAGFGMLERRGALGKATRRACILVDSGFHQARPDVAQALQQLYPGERNLLVVVPGNESSKSLEKASEILGTMIKAGFTRSDLVIAVGGGVVGDLGGFVASLYHRGMDIVHVPTTFLAMVDSSIGGKTAVNHPDGKNLVGTFHQPLAVIAVRDFLRTLPEADFLSGLGEVFKYAVGFSPSLFRYLEANSGKVLARDHAALTKIVLESVKIKAAVVRDDERESGVAALKSGGRSRFADRRLLNLGHTAGHGLEKAYALPHGVAVAAGVTLAAKLSVRLKLCPQKCYDQVMGLGARLGLKTHADLRWSLGEILPYMKRDKKVAGDALQYVCLKGVGRSFVRPVGFDELALLEAP